MPRLAGLGEGVGIMPEQPSISELVTQWRELQRQGNAISLAALCAGCPERLPALKKHLDELAQMESFLGLAGSERTNQPVAEDESKPQQPTKDALQALPDTRDRTPSAPSVPAPVANLPSVAGHEILGVLGRGGMGVVYKARSRSRDALVALKMLPAVDPAALYRFKQEFRALAGMAHPNLVSLFELIAEGSVWCFTMELVDGKDFLSYVRCPEEEVTLSALRTPRPRGLTPIQLSRLRTAQLQLADALEALHGVGKLHRDIKPSNVLVSNSGRLVMLDFGLAAEMGAQGLYQSTEGHVVGTVAYMAPEQAAGQPVSAASDWYSVGVMLYEAATSQLPFRGSAVRVLQDKQVLDPPPPRELAPETPADLAELCMGLLRREPAMRFGGPEVRAWAAAGVAQPVQAAAPPAGAPARPTFVGRDEHLQILADSFAAVQRGQAVRVQVHGRSGVGKSALLQRFLDGLGEETVVLAGRCYEQESVPYKALDSLVDSLSRYLKLLPASEAEALMPRDMAALVRLFPVLGRIDVVARAPGPPREIADLQELRRRAFRALRELLARLGDRRRLVLCIDDLQWGDVDSAALLIDLLEPPDPPALLFVACYRSEDAERSPCLRLLLGSPGKGTRALDRRELAVGPLTAVEARNLSLRLLGSGTPLAEAQAEALVRESGGSPFFIHELVQSLQTADGAVPTASGQQPALDAVLWARMQRLPDEARRLLEVVAVSGRPLRLVDARQVAALERDERQALNVLRSARLVRTTGLADLEELETYHDRVRETIVAHLAPPVSEALHLRLARTLEGCGPGDPEILATHFHRGGDLARAGNYYAAAAAQAAEALAFDRAAKLYRLALDLHAVHGPEACRRWTALGDALANGGRGPEAASAYLAALATTDDAGVALMLQQRAAMQLLISGHMDEGLVVLDRALRSVGLTLPGTPWRALVSLLFRRLWVRLRGLGFRLRDADQVPSEQLACIDICWSASVGLSTTDYIRGACFQTRGLLVALRAGEPQRLARALALEAVHVSAAGPSAGPRAARILACAEGLADKVVHPYPRGMVLLARGMVAFLHGQWQTACQFLRAAEELLRSRCTGVAWELDSTHIWELLSLIHMGEVSQLSKRWPLFVKHAQERGDRYAASLSTYAIAIDRLAADEPEEARQQSRLAMDQWSQQGFHVQHHIALLGHGLIELYRGDGLAALHLIREKWPQYQRTFLLRVQEIRIDVVQLRAWSALMAARSAANPAAFLRRAARDGRRLRRERVPWAEALARLIEAGVAAVRGDRDHAALLLRAALANLEAVDMHLFAAAARRRLGELIGGEEGRALVAQADAWMRNQTIQNPERMAAAFAPGFA